MIREMAGAKPAHKHHSVSWTSKMPALFSTLQQIFVVGSDGDEEDSLAEIAMCITIKDMVRQLCKQPCNAGMTE